MNYDESTGNLIFAIHYSAGKHRNQRRKDIPRSPYINHPIDVVEILWKIGLVRDSTTLIAALLHDTIEDTDATAIEISKLFGNEVLQLVLEVTDDKTLPKSVRKRIQILHASSISMSAKTIKLADKICNLRDLIYSPPRLWSNQRKQNYLLWTESVVAGLRGTNPALEKMYDEYLIAGKKILEITR